MTDVIDIWLDHGTVKTDELFAAVRALRARAEKAEHERDGLRQLLKAQNSADGLHDRIWNAAIEASAEKAVESDAISIAIRNLKRL